MHEIIYILNCVIFQKKKKIDHGWITVVSIELKNAILFCQNSVVLIQ